jgi:HSP20 family protein
MAAPTPTRGREMTPRPQRRFQPFRELDQLQAQVGELFENAFAGAPAEGLPWIPAVDIEETDDAWIVEAELPGVDKKDVNIELRDSELLVNGDIKERERKGILRRRTRRVGEFEFRVTLPGATDADKVDAKLDGGILTIRIPKPEQARPRKVEISGG